MTVDVGWDPQQYLRFGDERSRPFTDLLRRVPAPDPRYVVDLGCGPGNLTATLAARWPGAYVRGIDSSPEMIARARESAPPGRVEFTLGDLRAWRPARDVDVLVSNATLQWVPGHLDLFPQLVGALAPGGWFAFQVPGNFDAPSHRLLAELRAAPEWRSRLGALEEHAPAVHEPEEYLATLAGLGCAVDAWETTYLHVLAGEDAVLTWMKGTGLRPVIGALDEADLGRFLEDYGAALRAAYPRHEYGTVLPYRRIFAVAHRETR